MATRERKRLPSVERCQALSTPRYARGTMHQCSRRAIGTVTVGNRAAVHRVCTVHARMHATGRYVPWGVDRGNGVWEYGADPIAAPPPAAGGET